MNQNIQLPYHCSGYGYCISDMEHRADGSIYIEWESEEGGRYRAVYTKEEGEKRLAEHREWLESHQYELFAERVTIYFRKQIRDFQCIQIAQLEGFGSKRLDALVLVLDWNSRVKSVRKARARRATYSIGEVFSFPAA